VPADVGPRAMTSAATPSPYVISSSSSAFNPIWQTFDGNYGTTGTLTSGGFGSPVFVEVDLGAANAAPVTGYAIYGDGGGFVARFPKDFTLQGSNDNSVWTTLDAQTSQTDTSPRTYTLGGITASYRYYKIVITANNGDTSYTDMTELRLYNGTRVLNTYGTIAPLYLGGIRLGLTWGHVSHRRGGRSCRAASGRDDRLCQCLNALIIKGPSNGLGAPVGGGSVWPAPPPD
jgi:F5/8 type C domain